ncbi:uncharacterized protein LOC131153936 isoform X2 [Malania oleifera]|uniref:uncharacterized protein LOC131153936 isoform X2 n=1 Tax=Malania oleifera TaxID=397392 RepID=UPI0025ADD080|nr:uncharacterized protein LOC131153936 isoform X2 [Malania oleifera]
MSQISGFEASHGHSEPRTCSGKKPLKSCKMKGSLDNIVLIDVDSDNFHNIIVIDVPDSLKQKLRGSRVRRESSKFPLRSVISIDDDGSSDDDCQGIGAEGAGNLCDDASSSKRSCPASNHFQDPADSVGDECQFIHERNSPLNLSKCKRTYSGKLPSRNRYGLDSESQSGSSESDCSDCEVTLREQWENASLKRKYDFCNGQTILEDQAGASSSHTAACQNAEDENSPEKHPETAVCSNSSNVNYEEKSSFVKSGGGNFNGTPPNFATRSPEDFNHKSMEETQDVHDRAENCAEYPPFNFPEWQTYEPFDHGGTGTMFCEKQEQCSQQPSSWSDQEQVHARSFFQAKRWNLSEEPCLFDRAPSLSIPIDHGKANVLDEEVTQCERNCSIETKIDCETVFSKDKDEEFQEVPSDCNVFCTKESKDKRSSFMEKEKAVSEEFSFSAQPSVEKLVHHGVACEDRVGIVLENMSGCKTQSQGNLDVENNEANSQEKVKSNYEKPYFCNNRSDESQAKWGRSRLVDVKEPIIESICDSQLQDRFHSQDGEGTYSVQSCIINEREKIKETAEYKKAVEEEWASRQRQLQIQAEEAQRLRKRRKAESMRLLDMERRQKQRVQEMRDIQKKDEENMNLKEQHRVEVRNELNRLEMTCSDMASLLRSLGIHVGGGLHPLLHEVNAAYKRGLLSFHPDRASRTDIRQQVEAEEKFKLICRMKEKLLPSC